MSGRPALGRAFALVALVALVPPAAALADGSAMFGVPADSTPAAAAAAAACRAGTSATNDALLLASDIVIRVEDLQRLGELALLAGVPEAPLAPPTPAPAPRARRAPVAPVAPVPMTAARASRDAAREALRAARVIRAGRTGRTSIDTTLAVRPGVKLELHNFGGTIRIGTWPRNAVRVQAEHSRRDWVEFEQKKGVLRVQSASKLGPSSAIEFRLTLPAWMAISLSGVYNDVTADGVEGGIEVETVRGDIAVRRAVGLIDLRSVEGLVELADAKGNVKVSSVNDGVRLLRVVGDVQAEAVNGDIQLLDLTSNNVEATTVNGAVLYDGKLFDGGSYRFSTHSGDIAVALAEAANATVSVSTYDGEFESPFPIRLGRSEHGKSFSFAVGNGKAQLDLESFQGAIQLFRPGDRAMLARFKESWTESARERSREMKWMLKDAQQDDEDEDDADAADTPAPTPHGKSHK